MAKFDERWWKRQGSKLLRGLTLSRYWGHNLDVSVLNVLRSMPIFEPNSGGSYRSKVPLALMAANQSFPLLARLSAASGREPLGIQNLESLSDSASSAQSELASLFKKYGSDKASFHNYHLLYGHVLPERRELRKLFEIGLGTNYSDVVSNMGYHGKPGASLRAFRDYFFEGQIFGADVDKRILFTDERIETFYIDQLDDASFGDLPSTARTDVDVFIDDGLHSPDANLRSLIYGINMVRPGGCIIIEDIREEALPIWQCAGALLSSDWSPAIYGAKSAYMFYCRRPK